MEYKHNLLNERKEKNMNYNDLEFLVRIYNTLLLVNTKGEDTMIMGECLKSLQKFLLNKKQEFEQQKTNSNEEV